MHQKFDLVQGGKLTKKLLFIDFNHQKPENIVGWALEYVNCSRELSDWLCLHVREFKLKGWN